MKVEQAVVIFRGDVSDSEIKCVVRCSDEKKWCLRGD